VVTIEAVLSPGTESRLSLVMLTEAVIAPTASGMTVTVKVLVPAFAKLVVVAIILLPFVARLQGGETLALTKVTLGGKVFVSVALGAPNGPRLSIPMVYTRLLPKVTGLTELVIQVARSLEYWTMKLLVLELFPAGPVTVSKPVLAPFGTVATICVLFSETTAAGAPENWIVLFWKFCPLSVTLLPGGP
jgi:hypothetical protein